MDKIFRLTKVTKFSDGDENFVLREILSDIVLSDKVLLFVNVEIYVDFIIIMKFIFLRYVVLFNIIFKSFIFNRNRLL